MKIFNKTNCIFFTCQRVLIRFELVCCHAALLNLIYFNFVPFIYFRLHLEFANFVLVACYRFQKNMYALAVNIKMIRKQSVLVIFSKLKALEMSNNNTIACCRSSMFLKAIFNSGETGAKEIKSERHLFKLSSCLENVCPRNLPSKTC